LNAHSSGRSGRKSVTGAERKLDPENWACTDDLHSCLWNTTKEGGKSDHLIAVITLWKIWKQRNDR